MADETDKRLARTTRELGQLDRDLERARRRVGIESFELRRVVETACRARAFRSRRHRGLQWMAL